MNRRRATRGKNNNQSFGQCLWRVTTCVPKSPLEIRLIDKSSSSRSILTGTIGLGLSTRKSLKNWISLIAGEGRGGGEHLSFEAHLLMHLVCNWNEANFTIVVFILSLLIQFQVNRRLVYNLFKDNSSIHTIRPSKIVSILVFAPFDSVHNPFNAILSLSFPDETASPCAWEISRTSSRLLPQKSCSVHKSHTHQFNGLWD